jgi:CTP synthase (UTP-ammonia lyase)
MLTAQDIHKIIMSKLEVFSSSRILTEPNLRVWEAMAKTVDSFPQKISIAIVGKYTGMSTFVHVSLLCLVL